MVGIEVATILIIALSFIFMLLSLQINQTLSLLRIVKNKICNNQIECGMITQYKRLSLGHLKVNCAFKSILNLNYISSR